MTRSEFQDARVAAMRDYRNRAEDDMKKYQNSKNKYANARRRFELARERLTQWGVEGFWTEDNELAYKTIYVRLSNDEPVSAL